jgi:CubicO group peptidase (beta-lactamase class C family)
MRAMRGLLAAWAGLAGPLWAGAGEARADCWSEVRGLAAGALVGQNVANPVPGFELLIMHRGRVVFREAFGNWSLDQVAAADSSTKTISGVLIMSLVDNAPRPFSLDTRLSKYIPAFSGEKAEITIRQCFAHTSGLRSSSAISSPLLTLQQAAAQIAAGPRLSAPPGSEFAYGGTSMHAAGAVAEVAGERSWNALFQTRIAGPLGLGVTRYALTTPVNPRIAGGIESNAREFAAMMEPLRLGGAARGVRILSAHATDTLFTRQTAANIPIVSSPVNAADYGVGVWLDQRDQTGRLTGALAAGARGFCSWIDFDHRMTGVIATDLTSFANIEALQGLIRAAAARAVRECPEVALDYNADGALNLDDLSDFITDFYTHPPIPGGEQPLAPTGDGTQIGFGGPCVGAPDAPAPYAADAYRRFGYRVGFQRADSEAANACPADAQEFFPNLDQLSDYITAFYGG